MKVTLQRDLLMKALTGADKILKKSTVGMLDKVTLVAQDNALTVWCTDYDAVLRATVEAEVEV